MDTWWAQIKLRPFDSVHARDEETKTMIGGIGKERNEKIQKGLSSSFILRYF